MRNTAAGQPRAENNDKIINSVKIIVCKNYSLNIKYMILLK